MSVKSPSKYTSLKKLRDIRDNNCLGQRRSNGKTHDYDEHELNQLIWEKEAREDEKATRELEAQWDAYEEYLASQDAA